MSQSGTWVGGGLTGGHFKMLRYDWSRTPQCEVVLEPDPRKNRKGGSGILVGVEVQSSKFDQ